MKYSIYSGAGNDFVMINNLYGEIPAGKQAAFTSDICDKQFTKIDGVIFLDNPVIAGSGAKIRMSYYNRDGSFGAMCGNGARCTVQFAKDLGVISENMLRFEAVDKVYKAEITGPEKVRVTFPGTFTCETALAVDTDDIDAEIDMVQWINVGSEHIVVYIDDIHEPEISSVDEVDIQGWGSYLRYYKDFLPRGANVNFVQSYDDKDDYLRIRTYERGVERETLACGTGIVSSALVSSIMKAMLSPVTVKVESGEELIVTFERAGDEFKNVTLEGSAKKIEEGEI